MRYNKEQLLEVTNGGKDVYLAYLDLEIDGNGGYKHTLNPCYEDTQPGLMVKYDQASGRYRHYDYGGSPDGTVYKGDCFDFVAQKENLDVNKDFRQIMEIIARDLDLALELEMQDLEQLQVKGYELNLAPAAERNVYFEQYGVSAQILNEYNVHAVRQYQTFNGGKVEVRRMHQLVLAYENLRFAKMYQPNPKKFWYLGTKEREFVFGWHQIMSRVYKSDHKRLGSTILLLGGEKDVLVATQLGFNAVCLNSETAAIPNSFMENLEQFERVIVIYDNDETGRRKALQLVEKHAQRLSIVAYQLPAELQKAGGKDISDYVKLGLNCEKLISEISALAFSPGTGAASVQERQESHQVVAEPMIGCAKDRSVIDEQVYERLPEVLKIITEQFERRTDKDLVLLSSLGVISSLLPAVSGRYDGRKVGCNLYLLISAPAASGKGAMNWAKMLGEKINRMLVAKYQTEIEKYRIDLVAYKSRVKKDPSLSPPVEPRQQTLFIPANTSSAKMIDLLDRNQRFGIIFETEADTLANVWNTDWGNFNDILRMGFHHEEITLARMQEARINRVEDPHLSTVLSGTPNQVANLMGNIENGCFSRFMFYDFDSPLEWIDQWSERGDNRQEIFKGLSTYFNDIWDTQHAGTPTIIRMSKNQQRLFNEYFEGKIQALYSQLGDGIVANVKRMGLIFYRLAMILTALRTLEDDFQLPDQLEISDIDFENALAIVETLFHSLVRVYSRLKADSRNKKLNKQQQDLFNSLPAEYSKTEFKAIVEKLNYNEKTGDKYIDDFKKLGLIESVKHGYYRKVA